VGLCVLAIWGLYAIRGEWWGGWCYGYRYLNDASGPLVLLIVPIMPWLCDKLARLALFSILLIGSVAVQFVGAYAYDPGSWENRVGWCERLAVGDQKLVMLGNDEAVQLKLDAPERDIEQFAMDIDKPAFRNRLWSWSDNEILFCVEHFSAERSRKKRHLDAQLHDSPMSRGARLPD
jgi:hypothetical protein